MHVITRKRLNEFAEKHPDALSALPHWYRLMKPGRFRSFGNDETHPLASLMEVLGLLIEKYEDERVPELEESSVLREDPPVM